MKKLFVIFVWSFIGHASTSFAISNGTEIGPEDSISKVTVGILTSRTDGNAMLCTGVILDSSHLVTDAHCFELAVSAWITFGSPKVLYGPKKDYQVAKDQKLVKNVRSFRSTAKLPKMDPFQADLAVATFDSGLPQGFEAVKLLPSVALVNENGISYLKKVPLVNGLPGGISLPLFSAGFTFAGYGPSDETKNDMMVLRKTTFLPHFPLLQWDHPGTWLMDGASL